MTEPFFSIIIPTLNEQAALPVLLTQLTKQTFKNFEVIIVDGFSEDQTRVKADTFKSKLTITFLESKKRNVAHQRNLGAKSAQAKYLLFFDADTEIPKDFLKIVSSSVKEKRPDLLTTWIKTDETGIKPIETGTNLIFEISKGLESPALYGSMVLVKKAVFTKVGGFAETLKFKEDTALAQRIFKQGYKYIILRDTYYYWSLRRFKKLGTMKTLQKYFLLNLSKTLDYPMGGHVFATNEASVKFDKFVTGLIERFKLK